MKITLLPKIWVLILLCISLPLFSQAQNIQIRISGKVLDSITKAPVEYGTLSLFRSGEKTPLKGVLTDPSGAFILGNLVPGKEYILQLECIGYIKKRIPLLLSSYETNKNLGSLFLSPSSRSLKEVKITAKRELIENRIDKLVYNAEKDLSSQTGAVTDILKKIPQISVDIDGNVELAGSSSIRFLINGKPSSAFGSSVSDVLQSIPANQIKSIEVITNPGAKYDGQGLGGIINIILKSNNAQGLNGSISLTAGTRNENGAFNLNYRKGKLGLNLFFSGNYRPNVITQNTSDQFKTIDSGIQTSHLHQFGPSGIRRGGLESGIGFDWAPNTKNTVTGGINFDQFGRTNDGQITQFTSIYPQNALSDTLSKLLDQDNTLNTFRFHTFDLSLDWKRKFKKEDEELEISLTNSFGTGNIFSKNILSPLSYPSHPFIQGDSALNPGKDIQTEIAVDYTNPIKKDVVWSYGAKVNLRNVRSDVNDFSYDTLSHSFLPNSYLTNQTRYHQQVYGIYSEISFPIQEILDIKMGFRYQRTEQSTYFSNSPDLTSPPGYNSYLPSIFLSRKLKNSQLIKLSFSRRIEPPEYRSLNPYINTSDPNNLTRGNPFLLPETADRLELAYSKTYEKLGSISVIVFYKTSNNDIQPYSVLYPSFMVGNRTYTNVNVITNENVGLEKDLGTNLFTNIHITEALDSRLNFTLFHRYTTNYLNPGLNIQSWNYRINLNFSYTLNPNINAEFSGSFNSARNELQGHYPSFTSYILGLRKSFTNKKASMALVAGNFLTKNVNQTTYLSGLNFTTNSLREIPYRTFGINFSWKFGNLKFKKEKDENNPNLESSPEGK